MTKHPGTGGTVSVASVTEQLVYEMGDPKSYITPDGVADFTTIKLHQASKDRVSVNAIRGGPRTPMLKVSIAYFYGYKAVGTLVYSWPEAYDKAQAGDRIIRRRLADLGLQFEQILTEFVGVDATHGRLSGPPRSRYPGSPAAHRRAGARARARRPLHSGDRAARADRAAERHGLRRGETGRGGGRRILARAHRPPRDRAARASRDTGGMTMAKPSSPASTKAVQLRYLAHARSGDKGNTANVGLIALQPEYYPLLEREVTVARVAKHFRGMVRGVERFELPNLHALNFLLHEALDGGGTISLKTDAQGKVYSTALLRMEIPVPVALARRFLRK